MDQRATLAGVFDRIADTYDQVGVDFFQPIAAGLVAELALRPGERVLDIGCGRGAALIPAGRAVGPTGTVNGIDISPKMVAAAVQASAEAGIAADVAVGDAQDPSLPRESFDAIASSLVLFFLPDPARALQAWRDLLVVGGRLGVSTFGEYTPAWQEVDDVFTPYLPPALRDARTSGATGPFTSDAGVEQLFGDAGLKQVRTVTTTVPVRFIDEDQWYRWSWSVGQRAVWESIPDDERPRVRAAAYERLHASRDHAGRIGFDQGVRFTVGSR